MLGEAGATVYCTGRSTRAHKLELSKGDTGAPFELARRPETVEETAEMVDRYGGKGIAMQADHTIPEQVKTIFDGSRPSRRLDIWSMISGMSCPMGAEVREMNWRMACCKSAVTTHTSRPYAR
jgi:hypothetical protein